MKFRSHLSALILFLSLSLLIYSCSKSGGTTNTGTTGGTGSTGGAAGTTATTVDIAGMSYSPSSLTVKIGTAVKWTNNDYYSAHTVTADNGTFNSGNINTGSSFTYTTTTAGTFPYHCTIHGTAMAGTLVVTP